jgi:putative restriction endonuclease
MKSGQTLWTREELILAINLYCRLPFGQLHQSNPQIISLASTIGRTPGSVAFKLVNFASLDPSLQARGIKGASNASKLDKKIWSEFYNDWESLAFESEQLRIQKNRKEEMDLSSDALWESMEGLDKERMVKTRINQSFFRKTILASYNFKCCITGISNPKLLVAGHIRPWNIDSKNRMNPQNGLCMNPLHDRAFELGYLTITEDFIIQISSKLKSSKDNETQYQFLKFHGQPMILPNRFLPEKEFLKYHNDERFII